MVSNSPVLPKGGIVLLDAASGTVLRIIPLQSRSEYAAAMVVSCA